MPDWEGMKDFLFGAKALKSAAGEPPPSSAKGRDTVTVEQARKMQLESKPSPQPPLYRKSDKKVTKSTGLNTKK